MVLHVLIVDDNESVRNMLQYWFRHDGYKVTTLPGGAGVCELLDTDKIDLIILDLGLPDIAGLTLMQKIREKHRTGIIIISGRGDITDKLIGLEAGADDYIVKPFEPRELLARARSVLRRTEAFSSRIKVHSTPSSYTFDGWTLDTGSQTLADTNGCNVPLTSGEYSLLHIFVTHPNHVLTRDQLIEYTAPHDAPAFDRSIDVRIGRVRKKLGDVAKEPHFIKTVHNSGYIFIAKTHFHGPDVMEPASVI